MKELSLAEFAMHLARMPLIVAIEQHEAMHEAVRIVREEAIAEIGHYQGAAGPFAAWAPLAASTMADRVAKGYPADEPLLRTGDLRDSIESDVEQGMMIGGTEGIVGSDSDIAVYQELGTSRIPPRSFLGGAAARRADEVADILGSATCLALAGRGRHVPIR